MVRHVFIVFFIHFLQSKLEAILLNIQRVDKASKWQIDSSPIDIIPWVPNSKVAKVIDPLTYCATKCSENIDCSIFELKPSECVIYGEVLLSLLVGESSGGAKYLNVPEELWDSGENAESLLAVLVFRHESKPFTRWPLNEISKNKDNPQGALFSRLDDMETFRGLDGNLHFRLCYPEYYGHDCFRWLQSDNPFTVTEQNRPSGFIYKGGPIPKDEYFFGLSNSTPSVTLLNADLKSDTEFWYAVGSNFLFSNGTIPGPRNVFVRVVELYLENL